MYDTGSLLYGCSFMPKEHFAVKVYACGCRTPVVYWGNEDLVYTCAAHVKQALTLKKKQMKEAKEKADLEADWKAHGKATVDEETGLTTYACGCCWEDKAPVRECVRHKKAANS